MSRTLLKRNISATNIMSDVVKPDETPLSDLFLIEYTSNLVCSLFVSLVTY